MTTLISGTKKNDLNNCIMTKKTIEKFGKHFLLGFGNGTTVYIQRPSWDCGWYWGFGYLHTYTNRNCPERSKDLSTHTHFDTAFPTYDTFLLNQQKSRLDKSVLSESEMWQLYELFRSAYKAREYSDMLHTHGAHITTNPCADVIGNDAEYKRINNVVLPTIFMQIELLLAPNPEIPEIQDFWAKIIEKGVI